MTVEFPVCMALSKSSASWREMARLNTRNDSWQGSRTSSLVHPHRNQGIERETGTGSGARQGAKTNDTSLRLFHAFSALQSAATEQQLSRLARRELGIGTNAKSSQLNILP
jgi:hypothetical protein